ncbi:hypothetical protein CHS0354_008970 [Potamilus streckersoni]|uniref:Cadherin domain-containing protein n=1 Tax=Potamilus streckersoni TaxID=2493646 RepID=A0AAE0THN5_9BIVA|nr:hypothetical protein CHS0354_008970 [Potamilus streckersoni]
MTSRQDILLMFIIWSVSFLVCTVRSVFGAAPVFTNLNSDGSSSIAKGETTASGTSIYTVSASDADGDTLTFTLVSPTTKFTLTMQTIYTSGTFDYEVAADRQYTLTLSVNPNEKERAGLSEDGDRVSNSKFKSNGKDSEVKPFDKSHPPPAVVALPFPNMRQPMTFENEVPLNNYPRRKSGSQAREKSKNRDPEKSLEEESRDGYFKQTSLEEPYRQPPSYWNTYSRQPLTAPMLPQQAPSTQVSSRQDIPGTPLPQEKQKYAVINRKFDGRAIDSVTGRLYEYNTKTNERQWVTTLDGKEVKLASESS